MCVTSYFGAVSYLIVYMRLHNWVKYYVVDVLKTSIIRVASPCRTANRKASECLPTQRQTLKESRNYGSPRRSSPIYHCIHDRHRSAAVCSCLTSDDSSKNNINKRQQANNNATAASTSAIQRFALGIASTLARCLPLVTAASLWQLAATLVHGSSKTLNHFVVVSIADAGAARSCWYGIPPSRQQQQHQQHQLLTPSSMRQRRIADHPQDVVCRLHCEPWDVVDILRADRDT